MTEDYEPDWSDPAESLKPIREHGITVLDILSKMPSMELTFAGISRLHAPEMRDAVMAGVLLNQSATKTGSSDPWDPRTQLPPAADSIRRGTAMLNALSDLPSPRAIWRGIRALLAEETIDALMMSVVLHRSAKGMTDAEFSIWLHGE